jgi:hypothetical protein
VKWAIDVSCTSADGHYAVKNHAVHLYLRAVRENAVRGNAVTAKKRYRLTVMTRIAPLLFLPRVLPATYLPLRWSHISGIILAAWLCCRMFVWLKPGCWREGYAFLDTAENVSVPRRIGKCVITWEAASRLRNAIIICYCYSAALCIFIERSIMPLLEVILLPL